MTGNQFDRDHRWRLRAEHVRDGLRQMWGDGLPASRDPVLTLLIDAIAMDDDFGRQQQLVVQGDALSHDQLQTIVGGLTAAGAITAEAAGAAVVASSRLPPRLVRTVYDVDAGSVTEVSEAIGTAGGGTGSRLTTAAARVTPGMTSGMAALPGPECGAWELDFTTERVSLEAVTARLMGVGHAPGSYPLAQFMRGGRIHEADQPRVKAALEEALRSGNPYECRFRSLLADGSYAWRASRARVVPVADAAPHLVGFLAPDE